MSVNKNQSLLPIVQTTHHTHQNKHMKTVLLTLTTIILTLGSGYLFIKDKLPIVSAGPTAEMFAIKVLDMRPNGSEKTVGELLKLASAHPAAVAPDDIAKAIKMPEMPTVDQIAEAVLAKIEADGGKMDRLLVGSAAIMANTVGVQDSVAKKTAFETWNLIAVDGLDLGDSVLKFVQEGDKGIFAIVPKPATTTTPPTASN